MAKKLFQYYELLLAAAELKIDDNGTIYALNAKAKTGKDPMVVDGKQLVMPFIERLREPDDGSTTFFHPFSEEFGKGESPAISALRARFRKVIAMRLGLLQVSMAQLASSATPPKVLTSHQQEGLQAIKECSPKVFEEINRIVHNSGSAANIRKIAPVELYLSRKSPGSNDVTYQRWLTVRFPLYEEIVEQQKRTKADRNIYAVKASDDTLKVLRALYEIILPGLKKAPDFYSVGSNNDVAPYSDALMRGVSEVFLNINEVANVYEDIGLFNESVTDMEWTEVVSALSDLQSEIAMIPAQGEASGLDKVEDRIARQQQAVLDSNVTVTATPAPTQPAAQPAVHQPQAYHQPQPMQPVYQQPTVYQQPQPVAQQQQTQTAEGKMSLNDMMSAMHGKQQPQYAPPVMQPQTTIQLPPGCVINQMGQVVDPYGRVIDPRSLQQMPVQQAPSYGMPDYMVQAQAMQQMPTAAPGGGFNPHNVPRQQPQQGYAPYPGHQPGYPQPGYPQQGYPQPVYQQPGYMQGGYPQPVSHLPPGYQ